MTHATERVRRMTTFSVVERIRAIEPHPDPKIERLDVIELTSGVRLVTGKHYRVGDLGIYIRPGALIPGWLAEQLWLVGRKRAHAWFEVREIPIGLGDGIKVSSPGLWCGQFYKHDTSAESLEHFADMEAAGGVVCTRGDDQSWIAWPFWRTEWREGFTLDGSPRHHRSGRAAKGHSPMIGGIQRVHAHVAQFEEHRLVKPEVAAKTTDDGHQERSSARRWAGHRARLLPLMQAQPYSVLRRAVSGATPAVGST